MSGYTGKTLYHRLAGQIESYAHEELPDFVQAIADRLSGIAEPDVYTAPQTQLQRKAQSDRGTQNPGPNKATKGIGKPTVPKLKTPGKRML